MIPLDEKKDIVGTLAYVVAIITSLYSIYGSIIPIQTMLYRATHVMLVFSLTFLEYPIIKKYRQADYILRLALIFMSAIPIIWIYYDFKNFIYRAPAPNIIDIVCGTMLIIATLVAAWITTGFWMPLIAIVSILFMFLGPWLPSPWTHTGYNWERIIGIQYITLEGIFGIPTGVCVDFVILFTIWGALLELSKAGDFFTQFSFSILGKRAKPGHAVTLASALVGGPSGSAAATTGTLTNICWPLLKEAGYDPDVGGGLISAGSVGAVLSPPIMGAAAFIIMEILRVGFLEVLIWATIPTILYFIPIFIMCSIDYKTMKLKEVKSKYDLRKIVKRYWFHFLSLFVIIIFLLMGFSVAFSAILTILLTIVVSYFARDTRLTPKKILKGLRDGAHAMCMITPACVAAGMMVAALTVTGISMKFAMMFLEISRGNLTIAAIMAAIVLNIVGLAVPITATYLVGAVIIVPAFVMMGVPAYVAHMFCFYYAVMAELSPPVSMSAFTAAAITGGSPMKTMLYMYRYALICLLIPFTMILHPNGYGLLLVEPGLKLHPWFTIVYPIGALTLSLIFFAIAIGGYMFRRMNIVERAILAVAATFLLYPQMQYTIIGFIIGTAIVAFQKFTASKIPS